MYCHHTSSLHVYVEISDDSHCFDGVNIALSLFIEKKHGENCAEVLFQKRYNERLR